MIRKAVGGVILNGDKVLLVHKVKGAQGKIAGKWDFPKGGMEQGDVDFEHALRRELREETGSEQFVIHRQFEQKICFEFDSVAREKLGSERQETTMFLVEYIGDGTDLAPQDDEIDEVRWFSRDELAELLFPEARAFFEHNVRGRARLRSL
ncbi:putative (di)nucleoside polyphosphate hydrolase [Paenibacillus cellulosilyticus]|uniref:Putative (Di)nucleoside polyphosphate hydrolase n=1 Tax=Paenibacillus cellulosilyticus TaxID=375489 RepID=A0A2V2YR86_9BACL|nr:NUDIX hydrolase [Paenibacillus cellulosilyticus]PWV95859.1 putative (di)nucleoside polyphosphate hydrolase [Paenibacillus cellulosilyticus]QKS47731.1 NUDIX hydrolase [Paenibacillus cellulosilyticus]